MTQESQARDRLIYDDLVRYCDARKDDNASIIARTQFLLLLTASIYAAAFLAASTAQGFLWQEWVAGLTMLPSILALLYSARPYSYKDNRLDGSYFKKSPKKTYEEAASILTNLANDLNADNIKLAKTHRRGYLLWCVSILIAITFITWAQAERGNDVEENQQTQVQTQQVKEL